MGNDRFFTPLRYVQNDMWVEDGGITPILTFPPQGGREGEGRVVLCFLGTVVDFASDSQ